MLFGNSILEAVFHSNQLRRFDNHIGRKPLDVVRPAQFSTRIQERCRAGCNSLAKAVRQISAQGELPDQGGEKTVPCPDRAERRDRQ